jgi:hypothetical protein
MANQSTHNTTRLAVDTNGNSVPCLKLTTTEKLATTEQSTAATEDKIIRIVADGDAHIAFGSDPTATTDDIFLPGNQVEYVILEEGDKVSVLGANLYVTDAK